LKVKKDFRSEWNKPGQEFRAAPFWAWNNKLEEPELRRQIRIFKSMGLGGFFMHSRVGLDTPYLSEEWFHLVNVCIDEAKKQGLKSWLYDEDRWPSGAAGGLVTRHPEYRLKLIYLYEIPYSEVSSYVPPQETIRFFAAEVDGIKATRVRSLSLNNYRKLKSNETLLVFTLTCARSSNWYNGYCYLDTMNKAAVKKFLEVTHEAYRKHCGEEFGNTVPGIFSDEPQLGFITTILEWNGEKNYSTPYNPQIAKIIRKKYGYDFLDHLPEIFFDVENVEFSRARVDYIATMSDLFIDAYAKQIGRWCRRNKISYTGHVMGEDSLSIQTWTTGSAMRFYEHMQMPGIDQLTECQRCFSAAKQVSSVANQFGQVRRLTETYGCTGWDFSLTGHKALGDWQYALGINFRCQHLAHYSMEAEAKRDYPASISYQSPWFKEYRHIEEYFARLGSVLTRGIEVKNILLLTPIESAWSFIRKDFMKQDDTKKFDEKFLAIQDYLMKNSLDFDFGDEDILARVAIVEGKIFRVNKASYQIVIVPDMLTMRESTLDLLTAFVAAGGIVIQAGIPAPRVDCKIDSRPEEVAERCLRQLSEAVQLRKIAVTAEGRPVESVLHLIKQDNHADYLFLVNLGYQLDGYFGEDPLAVPPVAARKIALNKVVVKYQTQRTGTVYELDALTGKIEAATAEKTADGYEISTSFAPLASRLWMITEEKLPISCRAKPGNIQGLQLPQQWQVELTTDNVLALDHFLYQLDGGKWSAKAEFVMKLDDKLKAQIGLPARGGMMVQPWVAKHKIEKQFRLNLKTQFNCDILPVGPLFLALEAPERYKIRINGLPLPHRAAGRFVDRSCHKLKIGNSMLKTGLNTVELSCFYDASHKGLEAVFVLGDFGVALEADGMTGRLTKAVRKLNNGDWVPQGLPFYPGNVDYVTRIDRKSNNGVRLQLPEWKGTLIKVFINKRAIKTFIVPPYELDVSRYIAKKAEFELRIRVFGSPRNSHGPFFHVDPSPAWCGPDQFKSYNSSRRNLIACGLLK
jgi:hypothetical protein